MQRIVAGDASLKCHAVLIQQRLVIEAPRVVACARDRTVVPLILLLGNCSSCATYDCDGYVVRYAAAMLGACCLYRSIPRSFGWIVIVLSIVTSKP